MRVFRKRFPIHKLRQQLLYRAWNRNRRIDRECAEAMADKGLTYKDAGVDIDAGNELVQRIAGRVKKTHGPEVLTGLGGFGGLFSLARFDFKDPVLVSGTDGVGTKLELASMTDRHASIGIDLVAMCVNDILTAGAEPLFFLDYFACGKLDVERAERVISGIARGCELGGCALIGGETAEMPGMYENEKYDLAGFAVGIVDRGNIIDGSRIAPGDTLLGIGSSGPHSNGYSLIRKLLAQHEDALAHELEGGVRLGDALMEPTRIYTSAIAALQEVADVRGLVHVTGGGLPENVPRILPKNCVARIFLERWPRQPVFNWLQQAGEISDTELLRTFNCGLGMIAVVARDNSEEALAALRRDGQQAWQIGRIESGERGVQIV